MDRVTRLAKKAWDGYAWRIMGAAGVYVVGGWVHNRYKRSVFREEMCKRAMPIGDAPVLDPRDPPYRIQVILNRKSGRGSVRDVWDDDIRPVFQYAAHIYDDGPLKVLMTEEPEDAKRQVQELDLSSIDGLCVVGGDGLMQEVVTGLMRRPDREAVSKLPIGVIPVGSSNMFASTLHADGEADHSTEGEAGWAALTVALQETKKVDVLELTTHDGHTAYALSAVGWGAPGVMAEQSEKQAWLRSHRYWYGAAVGMLGENSETSASTRVRLAYPKGSTDGFVEGEKELPNRPGWVERDLDVTALVAAKVPEIGIGCAIEPTATLTDGLVTLTWLPAQLDVSRRKLFALGFRLSKGGALAEEREAQSLALREFTVQVTEDSPQIFVDGEAFDPKNLHVRVLPRALTMYAL